MAESRVSRHSNVSRNGKIDHTAGMTPFSGITRNAMGVPGGTLRRTPQRMRLERFRKTPTEEGKLTSGRQDSNLRSPEPHTPGLERKSLSYRGLAIQNVAT